jgi:alkanesulfonate monooxygenase SsuD/methylene tetrahydromethanopterin reductase-like flavin-dependent oxidoreductase (luciferase family)
MALRVSISVAITPASPRPDSGVLARYAERIDALGFHAIYFTDHYLYIGPALHSVSAAAIAIHATSRIRIGFAAYVLPLRHPIQAAHEAAMLDRMSGGRLEFGVAAGSYAPEFEAFGIPFNSRGKRFSEALSALKSLWTAESACHAGKCWNFENVNLQPRCIQQPHPRLWVGSWAGPPNAARRIAEHADGWQASGLHTTIRDFTEGWDAITRACDEIDRDPSTISRAYVNVITHLASSQKRAQDEAGLHLRQANDLAVIGTPDDAIRHLQRLEAAGAEEVSLLLPTWSLDQLELIARKVLPQVSS